MEQLQQEIHNIVTFFFFEVSQLQFSHRVRVRIEYSMIQTHLQRLAEALAERRWEDLGTVLEIAEITHLNEVPGTDLRQHRFHVAMQNVDLNTTMVCIQLESLETLKEEVKDSLKM